MARLTVFEIQTQKGAAWRIDSVMDDRELAVMEAERLARGIRFDAVRVVEETFDESTQLGGSRTIFKSPQDDAPARHSAAGGATDAAVSPGPHRPADSVPAKRAAPKANNGLVGQVLYRTVIFAVILGLGLLGLFFLHLFY